VVEGSTDTPIAFIIILCMELPTNATNNPTLIQA